MVRYFKKELPQNPLYLPNGRRCPFKPVNSGVGILATDDASLLHELEKVLIRHAGGLVEIGEREFLSLRNPLQPVPPPKPKPSAFRHRKNAPPREKAGIDQMYIRWKLARGRMVFSPVDSGIRTVGRLIHVLERHRQGAEEAERRVLAAFWSWAYHYGRGDLIPCHVWEYPRSARQIGDQRDLPYLKDLLAEGLKLATAPDDILVLTNDDTVLHRRIIPAIRRMLGSVDVLSSFRINFERDDMPDPGTPVAKVRQWGTACLGRDLFAFRAEWLRRNWRSIPDFIAGEQEWDLVFAVIARQAAGVMTTKMNLEIQQPRCELDRGYVLHENHHRAWTDERFAKSPAKIHNNRLMAEFFSDNGFENLIGKLV